jgi:hypothetical protein
MITIANHDMTMLSYLLNKFGYLFSMDDLKSMMQESSKISNSRLALSFLQLIFLSEAFRASFESLSFED